VSEPLLLGASGSLTATGDIATPPPRGRNRPTTIDCDLRDGATWRAPIGVKGRDIWELWRLFVLQGATAWVAPPHRWPQIAARWGSLEAALNPTRTAANVERLRLFVAGVPGLPSAEEIERGILAGQIEERLEYLRATGGLGAGNPDSWHGPPQIWPRRPGSPVLG
jgi:hypothetical protein